MLINNSNHEEKKVKFISYDGKYPNLCRGVLTLEIDGELCKFGHHYSYFNSETHRFDDEEPDNPNFDGFWVSGGSCNWMKGCVEHGEWEINYEEIPDKFKKYASEINEVFNDNVEYGCCGGCI